jgi:pyruvate kinase
MMNYTKTKIVATMGPATSSYDVLKQMILAGVNVCRINFSHGNYEDHQKVIDNIRAINKELNAFTAILADLQGPKIRTGSMKGGQIELIEGAKIKIVVGEIEGTEEQFSISYTNFPKDVQPGEQILLDDGKLVLKILSTNKVDLVEAEVVYGGILSGQKGVNLPNTKVSIPSLTEKDRKDLQFALENDIEWIGLSFVRTASDVIELKHIIANFQKQAKVIAKIEKPEAVADIDNIIRETDAIMVARGDLGVEIPMQQVPVIQKQIVNKCIAQSKPTIIATQMMESMITNSTPTRAEVSDAANSIIDGADAIMVSGETSVGKHPVKVIESMKKIIQYVEENYNVYDKKLNEAINYKNERMITDLICRNSCQLAKEADAKAIITMTNSGYTAFKISSYRPKGNVFVFTENKDMLNTLSLVWGVRGFYYDKYVSTDHTIADIKYILRKNNLVKEGDLVVNVASMPMEDKGKSNMLKLSQV